MEWAIINYNEIDSIVVPEKLEADIEAILIDSIKSVKECFEKFLKKIFMDMQKQVLTELKLYEMKFWAENTLKTRLKKNEIYNLLIDLIKLCEKSLELKHNIIVIGQ